MGISDYRLAKTNCYPINSPNFNTYIYYCYCYFFFEFRVLVFFKSKQGNT